MPVVFFSDGSWLVILIMSDLNANPSANVVTSVSVINIFFFIFI